MFDFSITRKSFFAYNYSKNYKKKTLLEKSVFVTLAFYKPCSVPFRAATIYLRKRAA